MDVDEEGWYPDEQEGVRAEPEFVFQCHYCGKYTNLHGPWVVTGYQIDRELPGDQILVKPFTFCGPYCKSMGTRWVQYRRER